MGTALLRPILHLLMLRTEFVRKNYREPVSVKMHPQVWADLLETIKGGEYVDFMSGPEASVLGMKVIEDPAVPGIDMVLE